MAEYRLTQRAWVDLIDINDFTEGKFGACQTEAYYVALVRSFGLLGRRSAREDRSPTRS